jgi:ferrous iron transport protein A
MEAVMSRGISRDEARRQEQGMASARMPLAVVPEGTTVHVVDVHGNPELRQHLAELGFVSGAEVKVTSRAGRDLIVTLKGASLAIGHAMGMHITVG